MGQHPPVWKGQQATVAAGFADDVLITGGERRVVQEHVGYHPPLDQMMTTQAGTTTRARPAADQPEGLEARAMA